MTLHERSFHLLKKRIQNPKFKDNFNFVFLGDSRGRGPADNCYTMNGEFELVLKKAVEMDPLFIVHGGDSVFTGELPYLQDFVHVVKKNARDIPVFVCVGNHDVPFIPALNLENFEATIGKVHWVINIPSKNFRCIAVNDVISPMVEPKYGFTPKELFILQKHLQNNPRNTVVAMHAQPEVGRWTGLDGFPVNTPESQRFFDLIQQHHVKKVLVSHVHAFDEQFIMNNNGIVTAGKGIDFVLSGGAGAPLENNPNLTLNDYNFVEFFVDKYHILGPLLWRVFGTPRKPCI
jgi:hypothetical protein